MSRNRRRARKLARRARSRDRARRRPAAGSAILIAGILAALSVPLLTYRMGIPIWLSILMAIGVFHLARAVFRPKAARSPQAPTLDDAALEGPSLDTAHALIEEGRLAAERLRRAGKTVADGAMRAELRRLTATADRVLADLEDDPTKAMGVRRLLTFYLPNAASVAEGWRTLESRRLPAPERLSQTRETVAALNEAFDRFADEMMQPQMQALDLDLRVLNDALKRDLDRAP